MEVENIKEVETRIQENNLEALKVGNVDNQRNSKTLKIQSDKTAKP